MKTVNIEKTPIYNGEDIKYFVFPEKFDHT